MEDRSNLEDWITHHEMARSLVPPPVPICENGTLQLANDCKPPRSIATSSLPGSIITDHSVGSNAPKPTPELTLELTLEPTLVEPITVEPTTVEPPSRSSSKYTPLDHLDLAPVPIESTKSPGNEPSSGVSQQSENSNQRQQPKLGDWIGDHKVLSGLALLALGFCTSERFRKAALGLFEEDGAITRITERTRRNNGPLPKDTEFLLNGVSRTQFIHHESAINAFTSIVIPGVDSPRSSTRFASSFSAPILDGAASYSHNAHTPFIEGLGAIRMPGAESEGAFHSVRGLPRYRPGMNTFSQSSGIRHAHSLHHGFGNPLTMKW